MRVEFTLSIGLKGCEQSEIVEIAEAEIDSMTSDERAEYIHKYYLEWRNERLDGGWRILK